VSENNINVAIPSKSFMTMFLIYNVNMWYGLE
jgi:hypothetical protein